MCRPLLLLVTAAQTSPDDFASAIRTYIEVEKQVLADIDASTLVAGAQEGTAEVARALFTQAMFVSTVAQGESATDIHAFLAQRLDRGSRQQRKVTYQTFREFGGVFLQKEDGIRRLIDQDRQHGVAIQHSSVARFGGGVESSSSGFDKPFSLGEDSITRQLGREHVLTSSHSHGVKRRRKLDPMK
jgi:hypothetical protein